MNRPRVPLPTPVKRVLRRWVRRTRRAIRRRVGTMPQPAGAGTSRRKRATGLLAEIDRFVPSTPLPRRRAVAAAVAASDRVRAGLAWEWHQRPVTPDNWQEALAGARPDLLLVELAKGGVPGCGPTADSGLGELVSWCHDTGIPVVLWVTSGAEVPASAAPLVESADQVFVPDPGAVHGWRSRFPDCRIDVLAPAAQPRLHHPARGGPGVRRDLAAALVVDGPVTADESRSALATVVGPGVEPLPSADFDVWAISDSADGTVSQLDLPDALDRRLVGARPHEKIAVVIDRYRVLVDAGREDPTASWTLLEAGAAQTSVVTLGSQRSSLSADLATCVGAADEARALRGEIVARSCQPELRDREALRLHRAVLAGHTYSHRIDQILTSLGRPTAARSRSVSAVVPTNREHEVANIVENIARQAHPEVELVLVLHGLDVKPEEIGAQARDQGVQHLTVVEADSALTLGACMNLGIDAASGAYIAKMDDDNHYGAHYLTDLLAAFEYTDAGIVGKWAHYVWLRASDAVVLRYVDAEHTFGRRVQGGSIVVHGDLARVLRFADLPRGVDTDFLDRAIADGVQIYSADRFNFVSVRGADRTAHTWKAADATFMTGSGRLAFYGDPRKHVDV